MQNCVDETFKLPKLKCKTIKYQKLFHGIHGMAAINVVRDAKTVFKQIACAEKNPTRAKKMFQP